ncbi:unnamed protein product [Rotaria magnacalcarata]|uniref:Uncharacterized protein n=1 Tax=Rotaria magnacalcarata TaxID=392030 RepID=A0A816XHU9_9BILA|nr:unnamed protein product [Rotaria magnacalcarata]
MHSDAIPIVLINIAATTCEQSYVFRANQFKKPLNLYNCVIAKSSYGKSPMLTLVQSSLLAVRNSRTMKFREIGDKLQGSDHIRVIYNEATTAGMLDSLKGCTRLLMTEEGDVILKRMGAFLLPSIGGRDTFSFDDCRAQLINLYDNPDQYSKKLKNSIVEVSNSKLNILAGLTGEIIQQVITRRAQNTLADALYERFLFWVLSGDAIDTQINRRNWNYSYWPTIEQFAVMMSFFECIVMYFSEDSNIRMIEWCNFIKRKGAIEEQDDHLASRYGKSVDAVHRIAGLCQIIELTSGVFKAFIERYGCFEDNSISNEFISKCETLFSELYGSYITNNRCFYISIDVVERAIDVISGNLEQYKLLMLIPANEIFNYSLILNKPVESLSIISHMDKKVKKREKFGKKSSEMEQAILLFDSVLFTLKTLYECRLLKNGAAALRDICEGLVNKQILSKVDRVTGTGTKSVTIYIKVLPNPTSSIECQRFINKLALLENPSITMQTILDSCRKIKYSCKNPPTQAVFNVLNRPQYKLLDLDLTPLHQSTVKEPSSVRLFSDASVNDINSIQDDFDIPLNNCVLNNIDYEHSLQRENSTVSLTGGIDTDLVENEETQMTSENMMVGEFSSLGTHDCLPITVGSDASSDSHGSNNEDCNQYSENQTSQSSTDIDVLAGSLGEEILIDANGSENVVTQSNRSSDVRLIKAKEAENTSSDKRYRLILSDGRNFFSSCVLGADMIDLVKNDILKNNSVIRVNQVDVCNAGVKGDRVILIIRDVTVVLSDCEKIGDPVQLDNHDSIQRTAISLNIPKIQCFSTVSKSGLAKKNSNGEWQADDKNSIEVVLEKPKINANEMCNINVLDPFRTEWMIKARVVNKSYIREYSNMNRSGKVFNVGLVDSSGEIRAVGFDHLAERFYATLEIEKAESFDNTIRSIIGIKGAKICDFHGISKMMKGIKDIAADEFCNRSDYLRSFMKIIVLKNAYFIGRSLSAIDSTIIRFDLPCTDRIIKLETLRKSIFPSSNVSCLTTTSQIDWSIVTIDQVIATEPDTMKHKNTQYFYIKGYCSVIEQDHAIYMGCSVDKCRKKLDDLGNGFFFCRKCRVRQEAFKWAYSLSCCIVDHTGELNVCMFGSAAESLLEISPDVFHQYKEDMEILDESQKCEKRSPSCLNSPGEIIDEKDNNNLEISHNWISVKHCRSKLKKMRICSNFDNEVSSEADEESSISGDEEYSAFETSSNDAFQGSSVSTQTSADVSTVATQTPWTIYLEQKSNTNYVAMDDSDKILSNIDTFHKLYNNDSLDNHIVESDPAYICDDQLYEFLNKTGK